ncbi:elongation factor 4, partial [bacterium]
EIIPVINKIDLPSADPERVKKEIEDVIGLDASDAVLASAKDGIGIEEILEQIVAKIPPPRGEEEAPLKALVFDSHYDAYKGVIAYTRVMDGSVKPGMKVRFMATNAAFEVNEVGIFSPRMTMVNELGVGDVGFIAASIKNVRDVRVGDTVTGASQPTGTPLPGYRKITPMVFCGLFPIDGADYDDLRDALEKLSLNDASLVYEPENSIALGFGFRLGFLGLLHMEIIQERLEREYGLDLITTAPSVIFRITKTNGEVLEISNPTNLPPMQNIAKMEEPYVKGVVMVPNNSVGAVMELAQEKRGSFKNMEYLSETRVMLTYELPLMEIIYDFFDQLKSRTKGYASFDYEFLNYQESELVKLDVLVAGEVVDALSCIVHKDKAYTKGRQLTEKLKDIIPRQMFEIPIQATIGTKIVARETVKAIRKNVLAKCYGGDITRKRKLLEKQKEGKKRMKQVGNVEIPQEAFMAVLKIE